MTNRKSRTIASFVLGLGIFFLLLTSGESLSLAQDGRLQATNGIALQESAVSHSFAQQVTFTLQASSDAEITAVYLFYQVAGVEQHTESAFVDIEPAREINVSYTLDLRLSPLPPFSKVIFWWQIEDAAGNRLVTDDPPYEFEYTDNRFQWEAMSANGITVHWTEGQGDPVFGQTALNIAATSLEQANAELRAPVPESIHIYIYDTQQNLEAAMALTGRKWIAGQAHPELDVIVVVIPFNAMEGYQGRMKRYIPHEITHLLVYQSVTPSGYRYVPEWLDEGLATANEQLPTADYALKLEEARTQGQLIPLADLCVPFSPNAQTALLSYAQSGSVVKFIRERYGAEGIRDLLTAYSGGASCTSGVQEALNISFSGLETAWQASLEPQSGWQVMARQIGVWVGLWLLSLLVAVPMIGGLRPRR
jgi:hypothetical protein